ncbi:molybdopterin-dependent oxidoreductase [Paenalcaligenes niemegkensis]|uniref:molybdopterin-dependent oxidoreductase n=1 Tax=Paenalcaligenes niemegkensis TaxID=2895469 RepID=UPI001EE86985|nr:molybdopterin-dependent oxidoreductase [Paenalcaligenes niemegkensis]MCQ9615764.1 molybdopterin-dependent oxidoreductase [Paenalcaligenes niemegkensis]
MKSTVATAVAANGLTWFAADHVFADDTVTIPSASHWGPFNAVVKDGVLIGVQPIPELDAMPNKMLTEGLLGRVYDKTRVKYPMIRKSYLEGRKTGDTKPHLRGKEPFVRVTWEEALAITADAIVTTAGKYGNEALFSASYGGWSHAGLLRPQVLQGRLFNLIGGHSVTTGDYSAGASQISLPHIIGDMEVYSPQTSWEVIADKTEVMVMVGCDPWKNNRVEFTVADHQMFPRWKKIKERGVKFISINPQYTPTDVAMEADWVKIVPNTDTALFLAISYHVYTTGKHDQAYLDKYTVGFDKFLPYLLGEDADGTPAKTPEWAAGITGIPAAKIIEMADLFASKRTQFALAWSLQRAHHGEMPHWAAINLAAMLGKIGKPGEGIGVSWHYGGGGMPQSTKVMPIGLPQGRNPLTTRCPASRISEMLLNPGKKYTRDGTEDVYPDVKLVYAAGNNVMSHQQDTNELIRALNQQVETYICQDPWWCASSRFADIVLPATSALERDDMSTGGTYGNDKIYAMRKVIEPYGESLDDFEIFKRLGDLMGVGFGFTEGLTVQQILRNAYDHSDGHIPFEEFWEKGHVKLEVPEEMNRWVRHGDFYDDPEKNPLHTASGKIELYCETIAGYNIPDCPPIPKFLEPLEYLGNAKEGQVHVVSPHPYNRLHSQMANTELRFEQHVQGRQHVLISVEDAEANGIKDGELVELYNKRGTVIAGARVTDQIMKGVASLEEGGWLQFDAKGRCNSGSINVITTSIAASGLSQATSANTCVASLRKCTDPESDNLAFEPPVIEESNGLGLDVAAMSLVARTNELKGATMADMTPGEKLFYGRCTLCHVAREPGDYTFGQWQGITESMFPRAGLTDDERKLVLGFLAKNAKDGPVVVD